MLCPKSLPISGRKRVNEGNTFPRIPKKQRRVVCDASNDGQGEKADCSCQKYPEVDL